MAKLTQRDVHYIITGYAVREYVLGGTRSVQASYTKVRQVYFLNAANQQIFERYVIRSSASIILLLIN